MKGLGRSRELDVRDYYRTLGYAAWRVAWGTCDVVALKDGEPPLLVQVKSTAGGPWERFVPRDRDALARDADQAGANAVLAWWPPRGSLALYPRTEWPQRMVAA
jgi:Holliday junction resolvase